MSETPENTTVRSSAATDPAPVPPAEAPHGTPKVFQFAAWVAIVAGIVFIVAVIFFTGFMLGRHAGCHGFHGGYHHQGHKHHAMMSHPRGPGGPGGGGPAAFQGGGPAMMWPGNGPGNGPGQVPSSVSPSVTPAP